MRPLVLIDVDGPLNPWAAHPKPPGYQPFDIKVGWWRKLRIHLDPAHGDQLRQLAEDTGAELACPDDAESIPCQGPPGGG